MKFRISRRKIFQDLVLSGLFFMPQNLEKKYQVIFTCHLESSEEAQQYLLDSKEWTDTNAIEKINQKYTQKNDLINYEFSLNNDGKTIQWTYTFKNRKAFSRWNADVFFGGHFRRDLIPQKYNVHMREHYLV